ncbi:MAG: hypothetical protein A3H28_05055 [Acidobacteria bacterium RIFCSPLOWO2_02_FULL_61_28]|nr:MAG: hypothetical protein A3H28_05055 [Acidobacteria bacterium RIFCSPLOWO2_02_FULL_61_28]
MAKLPNKYANFVGLLCILCVLCGEFVHAQTPATTTVKDTVYRSDGSLASGTVVITWPGFVTTDTKAVFGGTKTLQLANGALAVALAPNSGGTPSGTSYQVKYFQSGGVFFEETWVVPTSSPVASPGAPTVDNIGATGSTTYCYWVSATNANGETQLGSTTCTTTGNATLNGTNYNQVSWTAVTGATGYKVYRKPNSTAPSGTGNYLVGSTASTSISDQSNSLSSATVPALNTTDPRTLSQVRVTAAPSSTVTLAASQVQGTSIVSNPSSTQTINAPPKAGVIPLQLKGDANAGANVLEIYDSQAPPALQSWFDLNGAFQTSKAPTFSTLTSGSLLFSGTGGLLSQDNTNLFWDDTKNGLRAGPPATSFTSGSVIRDFVIPQSLSNISTINPTGTGGTGNALGISVEDSSTNSNNALISLMEDRHASGTKTNARAMYFEAYHYGAGATGTLRGLGSYVEHSGTGTITTLGGLQTYLSHGAFNSSSTAGNVATMVPLTVGGDFAGSGTVTDFKGVNIEPVTDSGGTGSLTNLYGLFIGNQSTGTNNWAIKTGTGKVQFGDALFAKAISNVRYADQFTGADAGAKIAAAIADLPATGGTVDARGLEGAQTISSDICLGVSKPTTIRLGAATFALSAAQTVPGRYCNILGLGTDITIFNSSVNGAAFTVRDNPWTVQPAGVLANFTLVGNSGANAVGLRMGNAGGEKLRNLSVKDFTGTSSAGIWLDNASNWMERIDATNIWLQNNTKGLRATVTGGFNNYQYHSWRGLYVNVSANQTGISFEDTSLGSGSIFEGVINMDGADASDTAISLTGSAAIRGSIFAMNIDSSGGGGGTALSIAAGAELSGTGLIRTTGGLTNSIVGVYQIKPQWEGTPAMALSGDLIFSNSTNNLISTDTTDGADNKRIVIAGGGTSSGDTRGASIYLPGNERAEAGRIDIVAGNASGGSIDLYTGGVLRLRVPTTSDGLILGAAGDTNLYRSAADTLKTDDKLNSARAFWSTLTTVTFSVTPTFNASLGNSFRITLTDNVTSSTISNPQAGQFITLLLCQDSTGSRTMTWPTTLKLSGGSFPLTTAGSKCDSITALFDGTNWYETARTANL